MERLVAGRERIYLDRFWNEFSATPARFSEAARRTIRKTLRRPGAMHSGFAQFAAFDQDATDNKAFVTEGKLAVPVLALGGEKSFGTTMAAVMRFDRERRLVPSWTSPTWTLSGRHRWFEARPSPHANLTPDNRRSATPRLRSWRQMRR